MIHTINLIIWSERKRSLSIFSSRIRDSSNRILSSTNQYVWSYNDQHWY